MINTKQFLVKEISDCKHGILGYLAIDTLIKGHSSGGIRILPDLSFEEIKNLARNMTLKYAFLGYPMGGAKAGIIMKSTSSEEREDRLKAFGKELFSIVKHDTYYPGFDMGASYKDLECIYEGGGTKDKDVEKWKNLTHIYTSWSMFVSAKELVKIIEKDISECSIAIEGFGKVGAEAARIFSNHGARIVAVSNINGAIFNENGFDINMLLSMKDRFKEDFVYEFDETYKIPKEKIFSLPVDILLPSARSLVINESNFDEVKAKIICSGTNVAMKEEIEEKFNQNGTIVLPDFISNCGGVLGSILENFFNDKEIYDFIDKEIGRKVRMIINSSKQDGITISRFSRIYTEKRLERIKESGGKCVLVELIDHFAKRTPFLKKSYYRRDILKMIRRG